MSTTTIEHAPTLLEKHLATHAAITAFTERHAAELPELPFWMIYPRTGNAQGTFHLDGDDAKDKAVAIRRIVGGTWRKWSTDTTFYLRSATEDGLELTIGLPRNAACVRRVVGTREETIPATPAVPATTRTVEVVEWECSPLLDGDDA